MTTCSTNINTLYNNYFNIKFQRGTNQFELMCQRVNLPGIGIPDVPQPTTFGTTIPIPTLVANFEPLSVEFVVDSDLTNWKSLYSWIRNITNIKDDSSHNLDYQSWHISANLYVYSEPYKPLGCNTPVLTVNFNHIIPISLSGLNFQSDVSDASIQKASCRFRYSYYTITPDAPTNLV
jgi:hypothetical protein